MGQKPKEMHLKFVSSKVLSGLEPPLDLSTTIFGHKVQNNFFVQKTFPKLNLNCPRCHCHFLPAPRLVTECSTRRESLQQPRYRICFFLSYITQTHTDTKPESDTDTDIHVCIAHCAHFAESPNHTRQCPSI